ncbi:hypothetical protein D3C81_1652570 [compost metagenome]
MFIGGNDDPLIAVGPDHAARLAQLLFARQRQAQAIAAEVLGVFDIDGDVGTVFDGAQGGGHRFEHVGVVMKADPFGGRAHESMGSANTGHPASGSLQVIAVDTNVAKLRIHFATHQGALTEFGSARSGGACQAAKEQLPRHKTSAPT